MVSGPWFLGGQPSEAQSFDAPAILTGAVNDPSGARIPRASVHIHSDTLDRDASTNGTGSFTVTLPGGTYTVTVRAPGFRALSRDATLEAGDHRTLNFGLAIEAAAEVISVDPWADNTDKPSALSLSGNQLEILSDDPGTLRQQLVAMAGGGTGLAAPQFYVDGFSNGQVPPKSAIRAIRINSDPYSTVYDRPGFGRVELHGQRFQNRNAFSARRAGRSARHVVHRESSRYGHEPRHRERRSVRDARHFERLDPGRQLHGVALRLYARQLTWISRRGDYRFTA